MSDVVGWLLLSVVTALSASAFIPLDIAMKVAGVLAFIGTAWWGVRPFLERFVATQMGGGEGRITPLLMQVVALRSFSTLVLPDNAAASTRANADIQNTTTLDIGDAQSNAKSLRQQQRLSDQLRGPLLHPGCPDPVSPTDAVLPLYLWIFPSPPTRRPRPMKVQTMPRAAPARRCRTACCTTARCFRAATPAPGQTGCASEA